MSDPASPAPSTTPGTSTQPQPTGAFARWLRQASLVTGIGATKEDAQRALLEFKTRQCAKWRDHLMETSPVVVFMLKHLKESGCDVPRQNIVCAPCSEARAGGYGPDPGVIVLCAGNFFDKNHLETSLVHEMIHMYDQCRFKVDWQNLRHHACSEIRANSLSGDCRYLREMKRNIFTFSKQHQACVRRRAIVSVAANPACPDEATAERVVNEVWGSCFADTRPFDEIY